MAEDRDINREMLIRPGRIVRTAWVSTDLCFLGDLGKMEFAAVERAGRRLITVHPNRIWPPPVGHWEDGRFSVDDGRHELMATQVLGYPHLFVAWKEDAGDQT